MTGTITPKAGLAIAEIVFFSPALILGIVLILRHGFKRQAGWLYIATLSILRLIGASCILVISTRHDYSTSLLETAAITSAIGTAPLLLALLGFLQRIHPHMEAGKGLPSNAFRPLGLISLVGLILSIVGGTNVYGSSDPQSSSTKTGHDLLEAGSLLFLVVLIGDAAITLLTLKRIRAVLNDERFLARMCAASLPFLLVRLVYSVAVSFTKSPSSDFYFQNVNVYVEAFMQFMMEAIVVSLFIVGGLMTPKALPDLPSQEYQVKDTELGTTQLPQQQAGFHSQGVPSPPQRYQPRQQQRSIGDYRPSRLIRNALSSR